MAVDHTFWCIKYTPGLYLGTVCLETLPGYWLNWLRFSPVHPAKFEFITSNSTWFLRCKLSAVLVIQLISYTYRERFHWAVCQMRGPLVSHNFCPFVALSCWKVCQSIKCYCSTFKISILNLIVFRNSKHKMYHCSECYSKKKLKLWQMKLGFKIADTKALVFKISLSQGCTDFPNIFTPHGWHEERSILGTAQCKSHHYLMLFARCIYTDTHFCV